MTMLKRICHLMVQLVFNFQLYAKLTLCRVVGERSGSELYDNATKWLRKTRENTDVSAKFNYNGMFVIKFADMSLKN